MTHLRLPDLVIIGAYPWVKVPDFGPAGGEISQAVVEAFRARGIVIAPPRREVRMLGAAVPGELRAA